MKYLTSDPSQEPSKSSVESLVPQGAGVNLTSKALDFVVQGPRASCERYEVKVEQFGNARLPHEINRAKLRAAPIHPAEHMNDYSF